jgi:alpha-tubulin suppressor-like RCC1 family protein
LTGIHDRDLGMDAEVTSDGSGGGQGTGDSAMNDRETGPFDDAPARDAPSGTGDGGPADAWREVALSDAPIDAVVDRPNPNGPHSGTTPFQLIGAAANRTCGLKMDGTILCWGTSVAAPPTGMYSVVAVGGAHTCGLTRNDGPIVCSGSNTAGQATPPTDNFADVTLGTSHSCAIKLTGAAVCWGSNSAGQSPMLLSYYDRVSAGGDRTCVLGFDGVINCWGYGVNGQVNAPGLYTRVSAGTFLSCGVKRDTKTVACWSSDGTLHNDTPAGTFIEVSTGTSHACAIRTDGQLACWGSNTSGQSVAPAGAFSQVVSGNAHSCARMTTNTVVCWGDNSDGQAAPP